MKPYLLNTIQAARYLNVSKAFLERDRWEGARIPFIRIGKRAVRYDLDTLKAYANSRVRKSTSDKKKRAK